MRIGIATDHGGFRLKEELLARIRLAGHEVVDFGAYSLNPDDDYPDYGVPLSQAVVAGKVDRGVAICGGLRQQSERRSRQCHSRSFLGQARRRG
jgi:ribose 5-phosphate isomerase B